MAMLVAIGAFGWLPAAGWAQTPAESEEQDFTGSDDQMGEPIEVEPLAEVSDAELTDDSIVEEAPAAGTLEWVDEPEAPAMIAHALTPNLTPWGMFVAADWVVKSVIASLVFASVATWTVWLAKTIELVGVGRSLRSARSALNPSSPVRNAEDAGNTDFRNMVSAADMEIVRYMEDRPHLSGDGVKERIAMQLDQSQASAGRRVGRGVVVLAIIGSAAPFVGLFGTVWGIMNSFIGISESKTTNLAVVAPGIAEALLATAFGLIAAIPAVVIYNIFARSIAGYRGQLAEAATHLACMASREVDLLTHKEA